jgi:1-acyl-sn-glycerol-3-phosphate acyltransferase
MDHRIIALLFLVAATSAAIAFAVRWCCTTPYTPGEAPVFFVALVFSRILWRLRITPLPVKPGDGAILVANHRSSVDPVFIQIVANRYVSWMVAREYFAWPGLGWLLRLARAIPTSRAGVDTQATRTAIRVASEGGLVGMLPEGRINVTGEFMLPARPGAVLVALKARVPIVPCYIDGAPWGGCILSPLLMPARVTARFGEPIDLSPHYDCAHDSKLVGELMLQVIAAIARLAGRDDFQPRLAGRKWR